MNMDDDDDLSDLYFGGGPSDSSGLSIDGATGPSSQLKTGLVINNTTIKTLSGPTSFYIYEPTSDQVVLEELKKFGIERLPFFILLGDVHQSCSNFCTNRSDPGNFSTDTDEFLQLLDTLSDVIHPVDYIAEEYVREEERFRSILGEYEWPYNYCDSAVESWISRVKKSCFIRENRDLKGHLLNYKRYPYANSKGKDTDYNCPATEIRFHYSDLRHSYRRKMEEFLTFFWEGFTNKLNDSNYNNNKTFKENAWEYTKQYFQQNSQYELVDLDFKETSKLLVLIGDVNEQLALNNEAEAKRFINLYINDIKYNDLYESTKFLKNSLFQTWFELMFFGIIKNFFNFSRESDNSTLIYIFKNFFTENWNLQQRVYIDNVFQRFKFGYILIIFTDMYSFYRIFKSRKDSETSVLSIIQYGDSHIQNIAKFLEQLDYTLPSGISHRLYTQSINFSNNDFIRNNTSIISRCIDFSHLSEYNLTEKLKNYYGDIMNYKTEITGNSNADFEIQILDTTILDTSRNQISHLKSKNEPNAGIEVFLDINLTEQYFRWMMIKIFDRFIYKNIIFQYTENPFFPETIQWFHYFNFIVSDIVDSNTEQKLVFCKYPYPIIIEKSLREQIDWLTQSNPSNELKCQEFSTFLYDFKHNLSEQVACNIGTFDNFINFENVSIITTGTVKKNNYERLVNLLRDNTFIMKINDVNEYLYIMRKYQDITVDLPILVPVACDETLQRSWLENLRYSNNLIFYQNRYYLKFEVGGVNRPISIDFVNNIKSIQDSYFTNQYYPLNFVETNSYDEIEVNMRVRNQNLVKMNIFSDIFYQNNKNSFIGTIQVQRNIFWCKSKALCNLLMLLKMGYKTNIILKTHDYDVIFSPTDELLQQVREDYFESLLAFFNLIDFLYQNDKLSNFSSYKLLTENKIKYFDINMDYIRLILNDPNLNNPAIISITLLQHILKVIRKTFSIIQNNPIQIPIGTELVKFTIIEKKILTSSFIEANSNRWGEINSDLIRNLFTNINSAHRNCFSSTGWDIEDILKNGNSLVLISGPFVPYSFCTVNPGQTYKNKQYWGVWDVCTNINYRQRGFSESMLSYLQSSFTDKDFYLTISLKQSESQIKSLINLYSKFGFVIVRRESDQLVLVTQNRDFSNKLKLNETMCENFLKCRD